MKPSSDNRREIQETLAQIYQLELAGVTRYLHYSFMVVGPNRIPIQKWFRDMSADSIQHAIVVGEKITSLEGHPPIVSSTVEEGRHHSVEKLLDESLHFEETGLELYKKLSHIASGDIALEDLARSLVREETEHCDEIRKMLRKQQ